jgi:hypothetical protein
MSYFQMGTGLSGLSGLLDDPSGLSCPVARSLRSGITYPLTIEDEGDGVERWFYYTASVNNNVTIDWNWISGSFPGSPASSYLYTGPDCDTLTQVGAAVNIDGDWTRTLNLVAGQRGWVRLIGSAGDVFVGELTATVEVVGRIYAGMFRIPEFANQLGG